MTRSLLLGALALFGSTALAGYGSSSEKKGSRFGENAFAASQTLDNDVATTWQSNAEKDNIGQWLQIDVPGGTVDKLGLIIGFAKNEDTFKDYARVKSVTVQVFDKKVGGNTMVGEAKLAFEDVMDMQILDLPDLKITGELGGSVKMIVNEVYPGKDYPNLAVSEMRVHLLEFPAETLALATPPAEPDAKHGVALLTDGKPSSYWVGEGPATTFALEADKYGLASVLMTAGPSTHARPKTVKITANDATVEHVIPETAKGEQHLLLPTLIGYTGGAWGQVQVEVVDSWPGTKAEMPLAIGEVKLMAATLDDF